MSEEQMVESVQTALRELGVTDGVTAAGQFQPRGHTGSMFAGGLIGDSLAGGLGGGADSVGTVGGALAGARMHDAASGLPRNMLVGVRPPMCTGSALPTAPVPPAPWSSAWPATGSR